ncbi:hypothetical protein HDU87_002591 [Geranomyces variabilis]|uniref:SGNH hydrolase-type esterase domain-containing protein n=1 Tax=Geranomyces variabilis TaxID=109894 RepID=A0AAD5TRW5_9FUNG|nr:hypothetical protein HDU87_002591 [Geranomyces variabilis]
MQQDQALLFGDSITERAFDPSGQGWGAYLTDAYARKLDVVQRGFSGYNTAHAVHMLPKILKTITPAQSKLRLSTIFFGANDAATNVQGVPIAQYKENLATLISQIRDNDPATRVLLITPPPAHEADWAAHCVEINSDPARKVERTRAYADACVQVAGGDKSGNVAVLDTWNVLLPPDGAYSVEKVKPLLSDGLHFGQGANSLLGPAVLKAIASAWPELKADNIEMNGPYWKDIDLADIPGSLFR